MTPELHRLIESVTVLLGDVQLEIAMLHDDVRELQPAPVAERELHALAVRVQTVAETVAALKVALEEQL